AAVNLGRERPIDPKLRLAGALALGQRRIVQKGKAHRALDLQRAVAGEKYRGGMGIDALDHLAAMGRGVGEQRERRFLALAVIHPLGACVLRHRRLGRGDALVGRRTISRWRRGNRSPCYAVGYGPCAGSRRPVMTQLPHVLKRIRLNLARSKEFPRARTSMAMNSLLRSMPLDTSMWSFGENTASIAVCVDSGMAMTTSSADWSTSPAAPSTRAGCSTMTRPPRTTTKPAIASATTRFATANMSRSAVRTATCTPSSSLPSSRRREGVRAPSQPPLAFCLIEPGVSLAANRLLLARLHDFAHGARLRHGVKASGRAMGDAGCAPMTAPGRPPKF